MKKINLNTRTNINFLSLINLLFAISAFIISLSINAQQITADSPPKSILDERTESVSQAITNPFALSQHRLNYILPFTYVSNPNTLSATGLSTENVDNFEAKYQISVKLPIYQEDNLPRHPL